MNVVFYNNECLYFTLRKKKRVETTPAVGDSSGITQILINVQNSKEIKFVGFTEHLVYNYSSQTLSALFEIHLYLVLLMNATNNVIYRLLKVYRVQ